MTSEVQKGSRSKERRNKLGKCEFHNSKLLEALEEFEFNLPKNDYSFGNFGI